MNNDYKEEKKINSSINNLNDELDLQKKKIITKNRQIFLPFFAFFLFFVFIFFSFLLVINNNRSANIPSSPIVNEENKDSSNLVKKFEDYSEMQDFIGDRIITGYGYGIDLFGGSDVIVKGSEFTGMNTSNEIRFRGAEKTLSSPNSDIGSIGDDYSTTNVQIDGVDEGDIVKNDGKYIYTLNGDDVVIIDAYPAENSTEISRIRLNSNPSGIYISGDKLLVYGQNYFNNIQEHKSIHPKNRYSIFSFIKIYDISDRSNPIEIKSFDFEGNLTDSRMIGDYIYFITNINSYQIDKDYPVPLVVEDGKLLSSDRSEANCNCPDVYYFDMDYYTYNLMTVSSININDSSAKLFSEVYLLDGYQNNLFVSLENLYITYNKRINEEELTMDIDMDLFKKYIFPVMSKGDKDKFAKILAVDGEILSLMEKVDKIKLILEKYKINDEKLKELAREREIRIKEKYEEISKELEKTVIHKIAINKGSLEYKASGEVTGLVLNQFSMDESDGYFRIATTRNRDWSSFSGWSSQSYSNLYVLDENMKVVGKVEELAEGERIYAVRFMQNRAYMVTFKQTDPLFVIGLDNPKNPIVLGELKVPGFSSYLHPYDETTLIGLGKEADENGRITGGIKLSLFDVSDVANPKEIDKFVMGDRYSKSIAIKEHKAFLFSKDKNLLMIPVSMEDNIVEIQEGITPEQNSRIMPPMRRYFNGVAVFNISKKGFELKGKIDHSDKSSTNSWNNVSRSLYINDVLYSLSNQYLKANWLDTLKEVKSIKLGDETENIVKPIPM